MPKIPADYSKTVIYKIQHEDDPSLVYIGSTTHFTKRKCSHKSSCNNEKARAYNYKVYQMIRDNGGWEEFEMIQIKEFPCENKRQAEKEEDRIMREMKATLNKVRPYVTQEEKKATRKIYCQKNEKAIREKEKLWYEANKEIKKVKDKARHNANKEEDKRKHQIWYNANKESVKERDKARYEANKEKLAMKCVCCCGTEYRSDSKWGHEHTKKHIAFMKNNNN